MVESRGPGHRTQNPVWKTGIGAVVLFLIALGAWIGQREAGRRELEMRGDMLRDAIHMAGTVNPVLASQLTFTANDRESVPYNRIREQLYNDVKGLSHGEIYSMGLRDHRIFFGPETYALNDPSASPPGSEYNHPSHEYFDIFANRTPVVFGPQTDDFGRWVTGLAPVMDETGKRVIMVIGIDVPAGEWEKALAMERARPLIMTGLLAVILVLASVYMPRYYGRLSPSRLHVRRWVMFPSGLAVIACGILYGVYEYREYTNDVHLRLHVLHDQAQVKWNNIYGMQVQSLRALQNRLLLEDELGSAWAAGDERAIRKVAKQIFDTLHLDRDITALFVIAPDGSCLARGHMPELIGGRFDRPTLRLAQVSGDDSWGVELGTQGGVPLRYLRPWTVRGRLLGYLEIGKNLQTIVDRFAIASHTEVLTVLRKESADKEWVEKGIANGYIEGLWADYPSVVLIQNSLHQVPREVEDLLQEGYDGDVQSKVFLAHLNDHVYSCGSLPVMDPQGTVIASVITMNDITSEINATWGRMLVSFGLMVLLMVVLLATLWVVSGKIQSHLATSIARLQESEARYGQLAERSRTVTWEVNADGLFTYVSPTSSTVMGFAPEEMVGILHFYDLHPEEGREAFREGAMGAFAMKVAFTDRPNPIQRKDGAVIWVSTNGIPLLEEHGDLRGYQGTDTDITARRLADEALRESESRIRAITASAQDAIIMLDPRGDISFWNPAAEHLFGYEASEIIGKNFHALLVPKRYLKAHHAAFGEFQKTGAGAAVGRTVDFDGLRKDGTEVKVQLSLSAVQMSDGWHAIGLLRDVTEQREMEAEKEAARQDLEEALIDLQRSNKALEEATARANALAGQAEAANIAKSQFLANMSHEIRTPMNGIIGMTGLMADSPLNPEQKQFVDVIRTSSEALLSLINDILDFSKIEAHKIELEDLAFDLHTVLEETTELLAVKVHEKDLNIVCLIDPDVPRHVRGDAGRVRQVILNLGGNAVKFTHDGGVTIHASLDRVEQGRPIVRFAITDSGVGIPEEKQAKLFTPFTQVDGSITRKYGGTGLGLAISKQLAELMGGAIGMESPARSPITKEKQRGSMFWFTVAFTPVAPLTVQTPPERNVLHGVHVLVVDDSEANRFLVRTLLHNWGCRSGEAISGEHALEVMDEALHAGDPFQFVLMDMVMPGIDGAEVGKRVKALRRLKDTHLVMMTSLGEQGDRERMLEIGFAAYFTKPFRQNQLKEAMETILSGTSTVIKREQHHAKPVGSSPSPARILVAEDNPINQLVALKILAKLGYKADTVANGAEAVDAASAGAYDIILMDCQMPEMDGFEATRTMRGKAMMIPIIAMTANAMKGDRELCIEAGMNDYLSKPVKSTELASILERWLPSGRS